MEWPPQASQSDYDLYYSNCVESLYCDENNTCAQQFEYGELCQSDNQCFQGVCEQGTCQMDSARKREHGRQKLNTLHIILTVVGIILFLSLIVGICMYRRKRNQSTIKETPIIKSRSNSTSSTLTNPNHTVTNILQPDYESTFIISSQASHQHTPSMQQQELQFQLQRQLLNVPKPPPPYSP
ncbi:hypothetical protein INT48_007588 [Thamnidium elegans]|uniref:Uncharacterized protein n=1 Tax=Thamnidium elegans TaxID=101142 RepID=A0A8H7SPM7_9FUNG|nr:hypothetical protein INT48_007588 [Thamnidium elegans]